MKHSRTKMTLSGLVTIALAGSAVYFNFDKEQIYESIAYTVAATAIAGIGAYVLYHAGADS